MKKWIVPAIAALALVSASWLTMYPSDPNTSSQKSESTTAKKNVQTSAQSFPWNKTPVAQPHPPLPEKINVAGQTLPLTTKVVFDHLSAQEKSKVQQWCSSTATTNDQLADSGINDQQASDIIQKYRRAARNDLIKRLMSGTPHQQTIAHWIQWHLVAREQIHPNPHRNILLAKAMALNDAMGFSIAYTLDPRLTSSVWLRMQPANAIPVWLHAPTSKTGEHNPREWEAWLQQLNSTTYVNNGYATFIRQWYDTISHMSYEPGVAEEALMREINEWTSVLKFDIPNDIPGRVEACLQATTNNNVCSTTTHQWSKQTTYSATRRLPQTVAVGNKQYSTNLYQTGMRSTQKAGCSHEAQTYRQYWLERANMEMLLLEKS